MKKIFFLAALCALSLTACVHTNNLDKYEVSNATVFFEEIVTPGAMNMEIIHAEPENPEKKKSAIEVIGDVASGIGTAIAANAAEEKLIRATNPDSIAFAISVGVEQMLTKYYNIHATQTLDEKSSYIVTTRLDEIVFSSSPEGMFLKVEATVTMTDRASAGIVWRNQESETVSLSRWYESLLNSSSTLANLGQTARLASLSLFRKRSEPGRLAEICER